MKDLPPETARADGASSLLALARTLGETWGDLEQGLRHVTESASRALRVERSSVWLFAAERSALRCLDLYERSRQAHSGGMVVPAAVWRRELAQSPQSSASVAAVLDVPIRQRGQVVGALRNEHAGETRAWTEADGSLAASLADFAALVLEAAERRAAESALREREALLEAIMDNAFDAIVGFRADGGFHFVSSNAARVFGYPAEHLLEAGPWKYIHPEDRELTRATLAATVRENRSLPAAFRFLRGDGEWRWFEAHGRPFDAHAEIRAVGVARDVTERRRAELELRRRERQLIQTQKLDALGQLAGGIAHDFNNVLTAILGHADMALSSPRLEGDAREELLEIRQATQRAATLTRQLLTLSVDQDAQPEVLDLDQAIERVARTLRRVIGEHIRCVLELGASPARILVEPARFDHMMINLAINARDAMRRGGNLTISSYRCGPDGAASEPAPYAAIRVRDEGTGIPEAFRSRIFDPFFSTKSPGQGTGLGLTMVHSIVTQAGGTIQVESRVGEGSCFTILLPEVTVLPSVHADDGAAALGRRGSERVLLVEDQWPLRQLLHRTLTRAGYQAQAAADGSEALEIVQHVDRPFDLVVSDVLMPGMSGVELIASIQKLCPETRLLLISGYAAALTDAPPGVPPDVEVLRKPFAPAHLLERVRRLLDSRPAPPS